MNFNIKAKVVFISGGAGDIGKYIVEKFIEQGCKVVVGDLDFKQAENLAAEFSAEQISVCHLDVTSEQSVREAVKFVQTRHGRLDILVNVAGILCRKSFFQTTGEDFTQSFAVNVIGMFLLSRNMVELMKQQNSGTIINISSINGKLAVENRVVYGSTKAAVNMLTQSMALELAPFNITVNAIAPGVVDSKMGRVRLNTSKLRQLYASHIPLNRLCLPQDIADCVLFLSSPFAGYINGEIILVDGGLTTRMALPRP